MNTQSILAECKAISDSLQGADRAYFSFLCALADRLTDKGDMTGARVAIIAAQVFADFKHSVPANADGAEASVALIESAERVNARIDNLNDALTAERN